MIYFLTLHHASATLSASLTFPWLLYKFPNPRACCVKTDPRRKVFPLFCKPEKRPGTVKVSVHSPPPRVAMLKARGRTNNCPREGEGNRLICRSVLWPLGGARVWGDSRKRWSEGRVFKEMAPKTTKLSQGEMPRVWDYSRKRHIEWDFGDMSYLERGLSQFWLKFIKWGDYDIIHFRKPHTQSHLLF